MSGGTGTYSFSINAGLEAAGNFAEGTVNGQPFPGYQPGLSAGLYCVAIPTDHADPYKDTVAAHLTFVVIDEAVVGETGSTATQVYNFDAHSSWDPYENTLFGP